MSMNHLQLKKKKTKKLIDFFDLWLKSKLLLDVLKKKKKKHSRKAKLRNETIGSFMNVLWAL